MKCKNCAFWQTAEDTALHRRDEQGLEWFGNCTGDHYSRVAGRKMARPRAIVGVRSTVSLGKLEVLTHGNFGCVKFKGK